MDLIQITHTHNFNFLIFIDIITCQPQLTEYTSVLVSGRFIVK